MRAEFTFEQRKHIADTLVRCWMEGKEQHQLRICGLIEELQKFGFKDREIYDCILSHEVECGGGN
jgi:hypothetical protein